MTIDYQLLIDEAMLSIARNILTHTQKHGLTADQSFYISFRTNSPGVILSNHVKRAHPKEITIVLEHEFRDLQVSQDYFSVHLSFNSIPETIRVPFSSLTNLVDPSTNFSLQFRDSSIDKLESTPDIDEIDGLIHMKPQASSSTKTTESKPGEVVQIDKFRKKTK